jgi:uncharacterized membrane protein
MRKDPLAIGLGALACGLGLGGGTITLFLLALRVVQRIDFARYGESLADTSLDLIGLFVGIVVAAFFGWRRSTALDNLWQRGVIAMLAAVGALLVNFFFAPLADYFLGILGLALLAAGSAVLGIAGGRWANRGAELDTPDATGGAA